MPAVNIRLRWPDGQESNVYSPSTVIHQHLTQGDSYPLPELLLRADAGLNAASEGTPLLEDGSKICVGGFVFFVECEGSFFGGF